MESIIIQKEVEFRKKLDVLLKELSESSKFSLGQLKSVFRENFALILRTHQEKELKTSFSDANILALDGVLKTCESGKIIHLFSGEYLTSVRVAEVYMLYKEHGFSHEEIYNPFFNLVLDDDNFNFIKDKLYIPYESVLEKDAFDVNIVYYYPNNEKPEKPLNCSFISISIPKEEIFPLGDCTFYLSTDPNPNEIDFWMCLFSLEKYRNFFIDKDDEADKIISDYGFSSFPLESSKEYII